MATISRARIRKFAGQVARQFKPNKIILFGSYAYGHPSEDSDVDILVILSFRGRNPAKATEIWMATRPRFPIDIMVRKPGEFRRRLTRGDFFIREVMERGKVLYEAARS